MKLNDLHWKQTETTPSFLRLHPNTAFWILSLTILIAKFRFKLKKVRKITCLFSRDLNQISYYYTVEVTNRFKGLDLTDRVPEELWTKVRNIIQEVVTKTIPKKKKCKEAKWLSEEALEIAEK